MPNKVKKAGRKIPAFFMQLERKITKIGEFCIGVVIWNIMIKEYWP